MWLIGKLVIIMLQFSLSVSGASTHGTGHLPTARNGVTDDGDCSLLQVASRTIPAGASTHGTDASSPSQTPLKSVFDSIATSNTWGSSETESGGGSELDETAFVRECLGQWLQKYNVTSFVDAPCGDANWQGAIPGLHNIHYKGYDIADEPLKIAREKNANHTLMSFQFMDLTSEVPQMADIIMTRDVIQHLPLQKGTQLLLNAKASGARFLAVTTFSDGDNLDITPGSFYKKQCACKSL